MKTKSNRKTKPLPPQAACRCCGQVVCDCVFGTRPVRCVICGGCDTHCAPGCGGRIEAHQAMGAK